MRNWFNWDWEEIFVFGSIFAVILGTLLLLVPLSLFHYHQGLGPDVTAQPIRFLLDWVGIVGTYAAFIATGAISGLVVGLLYGAMLGGYANSVKAKKRLALDSYTSYIVLAGLLIGFGIVLYVHITGDGGSLAGLFVAYLLMPALIATGMFLIWVSLLETWRRIAAPRTLCL